MMNDWDAQDYKNFYRSNLGRHVLRVLRRHLVERLDRFPTLWLGYCPKRFFSRFDCLGSEKRCLSERDHIVERGQYFLCNYSDLPFQKNSWQQITLFHALEHAQKPEAFLKELWNILEAEGKLHIVVPSRAGLWARGDKNIFGRGLPYSALHLRKLLEGAGFEVLSLEPKLYALPTKNKAFLKMARLWEWMGHYCLRPWGGLLIVEAKKSLISPTAVGKAELSEKEFALKPVGA